MQGTWWPITGQQHSFVIMLSRLLPWHINPWAINYQLIFVMVSPALSFLTHRPHQPRQIKVTKYEAIWEVCRSFAMSCTPFSFPDCMEWSDKSVIFRRNLWFSFFFLRYSRKGTSAISISVVLMQYTLKGHWTVTTYCRICSANWKQAVTESVETVSRISKEHLPWYQPVTSLYSPDLMHRFSVNTFGK